MLIGLGFPADGGHDDDDTDLEMTEDEDATERDAATDEAIDIALDPNEDPDVRREAFRRAVKRCVEY